MTPSSPEPDTPTPRQTMTIPPASPKRRAAYRKAAHLHNSRPNRNDACPLNRRRLNHHATNRFHQTHLSGFAKRKAGGNVGISWAPSKPISPAIRTTSLETAKSSLPSGTSHRKCETDGRLTAKTSVSRYGSTSAPSSPINSGPQSPAALRVDYTPNTYQRDSQSVTEYAIWLQQFAPHFRSSGHNPMRHLFDRIVPGIKEHMASRNKGYEGFRDMTVFVEYLQSMEDAIPERIEHLSQRKHFPKK